VTRLTEILVPAWASRNVLVSENWTVRCSAKAIVMRPDADRVLFPNEVPKRTFRPPSHSALPPSPS